LIQIVVGAKVNNSPDLEGCARRTVFLNEGFVRRCLIIVCLKKL